jgi:hypothetical protein
MKVLYILYSTHETFEDNKTSFVMFNISYAYLEWNGIIWNEIEIVRIKHE